MSGESDVPDVVAEYARPELINPPDGGLADVVGPIVLALIFLGYVAYLVVR